MKRALPDWVIPDDLNAIVAREGFWESDRWEPIALTVEGDTVYQGRAIPLSWQIAFAPYGPEFEETNRRLAARTGSEPDAYSWSDAILSAMKVKAPQFIEQVHDDSELAACVFWVESEAACKALIELIWEMLYQ